MHMSEAPPQEPGSLDDFRATLKIGGEFFADIAKSRSYVGSAIEFFEFLGIFEKKKTLEDRINNLDNKFTDYFIKVLATTYASSMSCKMSIIATTKATLISKSETAEMRIKGLYGPGNEEYNFGDMHSACKEALAVFEEQDYLIWQRPFLDLKELVYRDKWTKIMKPDTSKVEGAEEVFDYRLLLPIYLYGISAFLIVVASNDWKFSKKAHKYETGLRADNLLKLHDKILGMIQPIPTPSTGDFFGWWINITAHDSLGYPEYYFEYLDEHSWSFLEECIYGVVEKYSGRSSSDHYKDLRIKSLPNGYKVKVKNFNNVPLHNGGINSYAKLEKMIYHEYLNDDFYYNTFLPKYRIRILKLKKKLYIEIGLPNVWNTIVNLYKIAGVTFDELDYKKNLAIWSLREVIYEAYKNERGESSSKAGTRSITLRDLALRLEVKQVKSLRQLLAD